MTGAKAVMGDRRKGVGLRSTRGRTPLEDHELLRRASEGDSAAFEAFVDRHASAALSLATHMVRSRPAAEDVVQESLVSLWRSAGGYRSERGSPRTYLLAIVRNRSIDHLRRAQSRPSLVDDGDALTALLADDERADETALGHVERDRVRAALRDLPRAQAEAIVLAYFGGLSHSEIAERLGVPMGTIKGRLRLGLQKLAGVLEPTAATA